MVFKLGTRTSPLALAQSRIVISALREVNPNIEIEIVGIKTYGDKNVKVPIWKLDKVGVFSGEVDTALLNGDIDFAVHSLKDLGTERPDGLVTAAILPRHHSGDMIFFREDIIDKIKSGEEIVIGTSAPRREELLPDFLQKALPQLSDKPLKFSFEPIRGSVNTRLGRLHGAANKLPVDAVVLAVAGISRLFEDENCRDELVKLTHGLKSMVLPLTACPGAPGQGVIIVEARADNKQVRDLLSAVHDNQTAFHVKNEREFLIKNGGGCHQRFGAVSFDIPNTEQSAIFVRGENEQGLDVSQNIFNPQIDNGVTSIRERGASEVIFEDTQCIDSFSGEEGAVFVYNFMSGVRSIPCTTKVWTDSVECWFDMARDGVWVEGCADGFGPDYIKPLILDKFLCLPELKDWAFFHEGAVPKACDI